MMHLIDTQAQCADTVCGMAKAKAPETHTCSNCGHTEQTRITPRVAAAVGGRFTGGLARRTYIVDRCPNCGEWYPARLMRLHKPRCESRPAGSRTKPTSAKVDREYARNMKVFEHLKKIGGCTIIKLQDLS